jgi:hypothetical protein
LHQRCLFNAACTTRYRQARQQEITQSYRLIGRNHIPSNTLAMAAVYMVFPLLFWSLPSSLIA